MSSQATALCWNPLELFCIGKESSLELERKDKIEFEELNVTAKAIVDGVEYEITKDPETSKDAFGWVLTDEDLKTYAQKSDFDRQQTYVELTINPRENYIPHPTQDNLFYFNTGRTKTVKDQLGRQVEEPIYSFLSFEGGVNKNKFKTIKKNVTIYYCKSDRQCQEELTFESYETVVTDFRLEYQLNKDSIDARFYNYYDTDPSIIEDTDSEFNDGTFSNMVVYGTGSSANISSAGENVSGHYASEIFDATTSSSWDNISIFTKYPYKAELGRGYNDGLSPGYGGIDTTSLWGLYHFNNESALGDTHNTIVDFAPHYSNVGVAENGTYRSLPYVDHTEYVLGNGSMFFDGVNDHIDISNMWRTRPVTISIWAKFNDWSDTWYGAGPAFVNKYQSTSSCTFSDTLIYVGQTSVEPGTIIEDHPSTSNNANPAITFHVGDGTTSSGVKVNASAYSIDLGEWHHYVLLYNSSGQVEGWIDGVKVGGSTTAILAGDQSNDITVGKWQCPSGAANSQQPGSMYFDGLLDELIIYRRALDQNEINALYMRGAIALNLSYRSCDDANCVGESFTQFDNTTYHYRPIDINPSDNRYFQYNLTYSNAAANKIENSYQVVINNVTISYTELGGGGGNDTCSPTSPLTSDHLFLASDNCVIDSEIDAGGNNIACAGTGTLSIGSNGKIVNFNRFATHTCEVTCRNTGGCFG